jgi:hypothetical protein
VFWAEYQDQFPILARMTARLFPSAACSSDVERLFSISDNFCSPDRSTLSTKSIERLTMLYYWLKDDYFEKMINEIANERFVTIISVDESNEIVLVTVGKYEICSTF